jgi:hypothetical protein
MQQIFAIHICTLSTLMTQHVLPLHMSLGDVRASGITKITGGSNASCARHPSGCHRADASTVRSATVRLVKLIEHTTEESDGLYQVGAT